MNNVSGCTFIRDTYVGAFCLFESMASLLPFVDDMNILDLGSTDGTLETLLEISRRNPRVLVHKGEFSRQDALAFADAANYCIEFAVNDNVLFWQADEIWHQKLLLQMKEKFEDGKYDLSFWRIQLRDNFQKVKWFPHPVHRVGQKGLFNFVNDGMNTDRTYDAKMCSKFGMQWFQKWGEMDPKYLPMDEYILDISLVGAFRDNIVNRRLLHAPMWHESPTIEGEDAGKWLNKALHNPDWTKTNTSFDIPNIMRYHVGKVTYSLRYDLLEALKNDTTKELLGL